MTFDDDYCQFPTAYGPLRMACKEIGVDWPPPEVIVVDAENRPPLRYKRLRHSAITDEERAGMSHVCRGAEYMKDES